MDTTGDSLESNAPAADAPTRPLPDEPRPTPTPAKARRDHVRGKLVVLSLIGLGLLLGLVALPFRKLTPRKPVTQPVAVPSGNPVSRPG